MFDANGNARQDVIEYVVGGWENGSEVQFTGESESARILRKVCVAPAIS